MVIWLVGMSGSGKTTLGKELYNKIKESNKNSVFIDGDIIRNIFKSNRSEADYSISSRQENAIRIFELCRMLDSQGINVVCCILCIFPELLLKNKSAYSDYYEISIQVPINVLIQRDDKRIYKPAIEGKTKNVVGVDIEYNEPKLSDFIIKNENFSHETLQETEKIYNIIKSRLL